MPQLQELILTDRSTPTPIEHTFVPQDILDNVATVVESTGVPLGNSRVSISLRRTKDTGNYRGVVKFAFPTVVEEVINGVTVPKVARTAYAELSVTFAPTSSEEERDNVMGMVQSALDKGTDEAKLVYDTLVFLQGVY